MWYTLLSWEAERRETPWTGSDMVYNPCTGNFNLPHSAYPVQLLNDTNESFAIGSSGGM